MPKQATKRRRFRLPKAKSHRQIRIVGEDGKGRWVDADIFESPTPAKIIGERVSRSMGMHGSQIAGYRRFVRRMGLVGVDIRRDPRTGSGVVTFSSRGARARYMRAIGSRDLDGGYGDG